MLPILKSRGLTKHFGRTTAIDNVTLTLPPGRIAGLLGRNGSGKSTLLHLFSGAVLPTQGECYTLGTATRDLAAEELAQIGFVPQTPRLIEWMTVEQHLRYLGSFYEKWDRDRVTQLVSDLELSDADKISTLTPGNRQKFAIICAVAHHPRLLLLDEPFSALDPIIRERVLSLFVTVAREDESTIVVSSHILHDIEKVIDWVTCIENGHLTVHTPFDALRENFAEWVVTARTRDLPARFDDAFVVSQRGDLRRARLEVRQASRWEAEFRARYDVDLSIRPLNLEQLFPLMIREEAKRS